MEFYASEDEHSIVIRDGNTPLEHLDCSGTDVQLSTGDNTTVGDGSDVSDAELDSIRV